MKPKTNTITEDQLKELDTIRQTLYLLSREDLPRPLDQQIGVAAYRLYYWLQQFVSTIPLAEYAKYKNEDGSVSEWPDDAYELWEAHK